MLRISIIIAFKLIAVIQTGVAIKCHVCRDCEVPTDVKECNPVFTACSTLYGFGSTKVIRGCSFNLYSGCKDSHGSTLCLCPEDGCNSKMQEPTPPPEEKPSTSLPGPGPDKSLKCYECTDCHEPTGLKQCKPEASESCVTRNAYGVIFRGCSDIKPEQSPSCFEELLGTSTCACTTDGCNNDTEEQPPEGLKCYRCVDCGDVPTGLSTCPSYSDKACVTIVEEDDSVTRDCSPVSTSGCSTLFDGNSCYCESDGCNSAGQVFYDVILITATLLSNTWLVR